MPETTQVRRHVPGARRVALAALAALALAPAAYGQAWAREYQQKISSESSEDRRQAIELIDAALGRGALALVVDALANEKPAEIDWYQREAAVRRLGDFEDERSLKTLEGAIKKLVKRSKEPTLLASLLLGAMYTEDERFHEHYEDALNPRARHPVEVKRAAIQAMGYSEKLAFVEPILGVWAEHPLDFRTGAICRKALKDITQVDAGRKLERWQDLWKAEGEGYVKPSERSGGGDSGSSTGTSTEPVEPEKKRVTTVTREMPLSFTTTGRDGAVPLLVIHDDTWGPEYFDPYLSCLDDIYQIHYVELPAISALVEHHKDNPEKIKRNIGGYPYYPYDALCDAFDEAREKMGHEKFALLAHGFSTMIAQRYLSKYPDRVTHAIFVGTFSGDDAYGDVLDKLRAKASGMHDKEIVHAVDYHFITDEKTFTRFYDPADDNELAALERRWFTMMFANPQDLEIAKIWERAKRGPNLSLKVAEQEQSQSPPFDISREHRPENVPVLVISGKKAVWFGPREGERVAANYPLGRHVVLEDAANMPWFDDPAGFQKAVRDFAKSVVPATDRDR